MDKLRFFRSVCSWGHVLFAIMKVLALLAAIFTFIGVLTLSFMPGGLVKVESLMKADVRVNMEKLLGDEWKKHYKEFDFSQIGEGFDETLADEEGITISQSAPGASFENRAISLALIPEFVKMLLSFFLFRLIAGMFFKWKNAPEPLRVDLNSDLYRTGWLVMALGTIPGLCVSLITLITDTNGLFQLEFNLFLIFSAFLFWAFSDLISHAKGFLPLYESPPTPPEKDEIHPDAF